MKKDEVLELPETKKSKLSRHLMTFVAGANIVLGTFVLPQVTHAAVTKEDNSLVIKSTFESVYVYEKLDFTSPIHEEESNTGCPTNTGCPKNTGC